MTIYHVGHEYGALTANDANSFETTDSAQFDSAYSRAAMNNFSGNAYSKTPVFTSLTEGYVHFRLRADGLYGYTYLINSSGVQVARIEWNRTDLNGLVKLSYYNGTAWVDATPFQVLGYSSQTDFDLYFKMGASGALRLYTNRSLFLDSGTINLSYATNVAQVAMTGMATVFSDFYSELVVADVSTIGWRVATLYLTGAGSTNTFTSGSYADIDEAVLTDSDGAVSATANQVLMGAVNSPSPGNFAIKAVGVTARAKRDSTGPQNLQLAVHSAGANYFSATKALDVGYGASVGIWETDPATSAAWATLPTEIGVKSIA